MKFVNMQRRYTCLFAAVDGKHIEIVKHLLSVKEIDVNKRAGGQTPLQFACERGHLEIARVKSFPCFHLIA